MNIQEETSKLTNNRLMQSNEQIALFEEAMTNIFDLQNIDHIRFLCLGFDDRTEQDDVMFGLIHAIEAYDGTFGIEPVTREFILSSPQFVQHANKWLEIILIRYLNDGIAKDALKKELKKADKKSQEIIFEALKRIQAENAHFSEAIKEVIG